MIDLSNEAQAILNASRELDNPTSAARERARRAVLARIAGASAAVAVSTSAAAAAVPAAKILLPAILVLASGVGGGLLWQAAQRAPAHPSALATTTAVVAATPTTAAPPPVPATVEPPAAPATPQGASEAPTLAPTPALRAQRWQRGKTRAPIASRLVPAAAPPGDSLQDETALLAQANAALRAGDTRAGLALLDDYDRRFPSGTLREETTATRIIARCQAASGGAGEAARRFIEQHPHSPLSSRVRSSCLIKP